MKLPAIIAGWLGRAEADVVWPVEPAVTRSRAGGDKIPANEVHRALASLTDAELMHIAATVIEGWIPLLLPASLAAMTDVDLLVDALHDRANEFDAEHERLRKRGPVGYYR